MGTMHIVYHLIVLPIFERTVFDPTYTNLLDKMLSRIQLVGERKLPSCKNYFRGEKLWK
jgi:hypothetical protein